MRQFEFVCDNEYAVKRLPLRNTKFSGGYDFINPQAVTILPNEIKYVKTGIKAKFPEDEILMLCNRSSNPKKKGLILANGVGIVDSDYYGNIENDGEIAFAFMNITNVPIVIHEGEKLGQGIFLKFGKVYNDEAQGIREGGFGSTGV